MQLNWKGEPSIGVRIEGGAVVVSANEDGLASLASNLMTLAAEHPGAHFHLGEYNSLEDGSCELVVEKVE